jgi:hypothetical protein
MDLRASRGLALPAFLMLASGCSSPSASPASDAGSHPVVDSSVESGGDGASSVDASSDGGTDAEIPRGATSSYVIIEQTITSAATVGDIGIAFDPHYTSGLGCAVTTSGPCTLDDCTVPDTQDGGMLVSESAGTVTLSGGNLGSPLMLGYSSTEQYRPPLIGSALFDAGATFGVSAAGAAFPAFSGQSAPAPGAITITAPAVTMGMFGPTYVFDPAAPLTWGWTGGMAGDSVSFTFVNADVIITCSFDAVGGTGTIPASVVAQLPTMTSSIEIYSVSSAVIDAGGQGVLLAVEQSGPTVYVAAQ